MYKYLYLTHPEWASAWVSGGKIPLNPASAYKKMDREGIYTPDENLIYESTHDLESFGHLIKVDGVRDLKIGKIVENGRTIAENVRASKYHEDGVILSLCNRKSKEIAKKLNKKACVKILDVDVLKKVIDDQLGKVSIAKCCEYTASYNRNHFLKSTEDEWQDEFRLFWDHQERIEVTLPKGIARRIKLNL
ncbi:hypothetical protein [Microbulbifer sp. THAF38]|uniref:hypothetical protein n=1 Tax=Microbulbifer sp. THAF38 TaxID=2587856 RepID=UPI001268B344|nr:hypothetical protein [Microbulbifer sp. THAF38]QFT55396.1 hypothetical protein FIU95_12620 [Microbulbifer sp. THAF38]